jgi:orotate phosphoribosyltransferase
MNKQCRETECPSEPYIDLLLNQGVLQFGSFTTKSGRNSPYFFNTGQVYSGAAVQAWATHYADALLEYFGAGPYRLFGPAYKGIPLVVATAMICDQRPQQQGTVYTFDRKEIKDHGEGGFLVGYPLQSGDSVIVLEDVLTGGTSLRSAIERLGKAGIKLAGAIVGLDRQEKGRGDTTAARELAEEFGLPVYHLTTIDTIVAYLHNHSRQGRVWIDDGLKTAIDQYRSRYGGNQ